MKTLGITFILLLSALDIFHNGGITHTVLLLAVLLLKAQAEIAAEKWQKIRASFPLVPFAWRHQSEPSWVETNPDEKSHKSSESELPPFQAPNPFDPISLAEARERKKQKRKSEQAEPQHSEQQERQGRKETTRPFQRPLFQPPRFHGLPHEVLGIEPESPTAKIIKAYRHWMKAYHPDKQPNYGVAANEKARMIHEAKQQMVEKRRRLRSAA